MEILRETDFRSLRLCGCQGRVRYPYASACRPFLSSAFSRLCPSACAAGTPLCCHCHYFFLASCPSLSSFDFLLRVRWLRWHVGLSCSRFESDQEACMEGSLDWWYSRSHNWRRLTVQLSQGKGIVM